MIAKMTTMKQMSLVFKRSSEIERSLQIAIVMTGSRGLSLNACIADVRALKEAVASIRKTS